MKPFSLDGLNVTIDFQLSSLGCTLIGALWVTGFAHALIVLSHFGRLGCSTGLALETVSSNDASAELLPEPCISSRRARVRSRASQDTENTGVMPGSFEDDRVSDDCSGSEEGIRLSITPGSFQDDNSSEEGICLSITSATSQDDQGDNDSEEGIRLSIMLSTSDQVMRLCKLPLLRVLTTYAISRLEVKIFSNIADFIRTRREMYHICAMIVQCRPLQTSRYQPSPRRADCHASPVLVCLGPHIE